MIGRAAQALYCASIWHPEAIPDSEGDTAKQFKRVVLPLLDLLLFLGGYLGARNVVPALTETLPDENVDVLCSIFAFAAFAAFVGVAFPRLALVEWLSKLVLSAGLGGYIGTLLLVASGATATPGGDSRWYVGPFFAIPLLIIGWRALQLSSEWGRRFAVSPRGLRFSAWQQRRRRARLRRKVARGVR